MKLALQVRGLERGCLAWPMGPNLCQKAQEFQDWFARQIPTYEATLPTPA